MSRDRPKKPTKPKPPVLRIERVRASCGHITDLEVYDDKRDEQFLEQRRAKTASRPCPACRMKADAKNAKMQPRRLPHGASFNVRYDAAKKEWAGSLTVPGKGQFTGTASAVFRLLRQLENQYWQSTAD